MSDTGIQAARRLTADGFFYDNFVKMAEHCRAEARREALLAAYVFEKICLDLAAELGDGPVMMPTVRKMEAKYRTALNVAMEKAIAGAPAQEQWEQLLGLVRLARESPEM
jgi:hypothetical protein